MEPPQLDPFPRQHCLIRTSSFTFEYSEGVRMIALLSSLLPARSGRLPRLRRAMPCISRAFPSLSPSLAQYVLRREEKKTERIGRMKIGHRAAAHKRDSSQLSIAIAVRSSNQTIEQTRIIKQALPRLLPSEESGRRIETAYTRCPDTKA